MPAHRVACRLSLLLLLAVPAALPGQGSAPMGRWVGGLVDGEDWSAIVVRFAPSGTPAVIVTLPNQRMTTAFTALRRTGNQLVWQNTAGERWSGVLADGAIRGRYTGPEDSIDFQLIPAPDLSLERLSRLVGNYRLNDQHRIRVELLERPTDMLLRYFDESTGEEQWLFPVNDSQFIAGPTFEAPLPVRRRVTFVTGPEGRVTGIRWQREGEALVMAQRADWRPDTTAIAALVQRFKRERDVPSMVVGIVGPEGLRWAGAWGSADLASGRPATINTLYQIGSVTKPITATLTLMLRDRGRLRLDDNIAAYLPATVRLPAPPPGGDRQVTLRTLLTHTAALPGNPVNRVDVDGVMRAYSRRELLAGIPSTFLIGPIGTRWSYSNLGYGLLGYALERASGVTYEALLRRELFTPLGMSNSSIALTTARVRQLAVPYWPEDSIRTPRPRWQFGEVAGFGGVTSTVPDLARFVAMFLRNGTDPNDPLRSGSIIEMLRPQFVRGGGGVNTMGFGWWLQRDRILGKVVQHGGEVDGFSSQVTMSPMHRVGIVVLTNLGGSTAADLGTLLFTQVVADLRQHELPGREQAFELFLDNDFGAAAWALAPVALARPTDGVAWLRLGQAEFALERFAAARIAFERAATLDFLPGLAMAHLARLSARDGDREAAVGWVVKGWQAGQRNVAQWRGWPELSAVLTDPRVTALMP